MQHAAPFPCSSSRPCSAWSWVRHVTLKHPVKSGGATLIYQIGKIDGSTVSLVGTDEDSSVATTTVGELVELYKTVQFVEDIIVRAADISPVEAFAEVVAEFIKSSIRVLLKNAFRLHQPTTKVDLKIKDNDNKTVFASRDYAAGKLKLVPFSKYVSIEKEKKAYSGFPLARVDINVLGPQGVTYVASVQRMDIKEIDRKKKKPLGDALAVPYWLVRCVRDKNIANMRQSSMACTLEVGAGGEAADQPVNLPILHNVKALKEGDELVLFTEPVLQPSLPVQKLEQVAKKRPAASTGRMQQAANKKMKQ